MVFEGLHQARSQNFFLRGKQKNWRENEKKFVQVWGRKIIFFGFGPGLQDNKIYSDWVADSSIFEGFFVEFLFYLPQGKFWIFLPIFLRGCGENELTRQKF